MEQVNGQTAQHTQVFSQTRNNRMAGSVPVWGKPNTAQQITESALAKAQQGAKPEEQDFDTVLAYHSRQATATVHQSPEEKPFGFGDVIDMVNPLHHIPVVGHIYREVTGDEIRGVGKIIGGAVFGGGVGAASGLVNTIVEHETGKDITENAMAMVTGDSIQWRSARTGGSDHPEDRLNRVNSGNMQNDLPASLLAFADTGQIRIYPRSARDAMASRLDSVMQDLPARESITTLSLRPI